MTLGTVSKTAAKIRLFLWVGFFFIASPPDIGAEKSPGTFPELLAQFESMPGFEAEFEESKFLGLLAVPLLSEGRLFFSPPSSLLRRIKSPRTQSILVSANAIRLSEPGREETLDLRSRTEIRPLVESLIWLFSGNREALESIYHIEFSASETTPSAEPGSWQVEFVPRDEPLSLMIEVLRVSGRGHSAATVEIEEVGGDRTVTQIRSANPNRTFTPEEQEALFGIKSRTAATPIYD